MRFIPHSLGLAGVMVLVVAAFLAASASLPYTGLTSDQIQGQREQFQTAKLIAGAGLLFFGSGVAWLGCRRIFSTAVKRSEVTR